MACALVLCATAALRAQPISVGVPAATTTSPPGVTQEGIYSTVPVRVDGVQIFRLAIAQSSDLTQAAAQSAAALRGQVTNAALGQILAEQEGNTGTIYDPDSLQVTAQTRAGEAVISAADKTHAATPLLAVTEADAQYDRVPLDALTERWRAKLQDSLVNGLRTRQPESYARSIAVARWLVVVLLALTAILALGYYLLARRVRRLQAVTDQAESDARLAHADLAGRGIDDAERDRLLAVIAQAVEPRTRLRVLRSGLAAIVWSGVALWVVATLVVMSLFPATTPLALELVERVVAIAAILVVAALLNRIGDIVVQRSFLAWQNNAPPEERTRRALRTPTIVGAVNGFSGTVVYFIAGLAILSQLGFPALSVIAVGGIAAVALSLAAQSLIQDIVNGFFVLFEDQYAVGDFVVIGAHEGLVEYVSLRIVRIRDDRGGVVTIPHSQARIVVNESRHWSRVDYRVTVAAGADIERALAIVRSAIETLATEHGWTEAGIDLEWIGVQSISRLGIVVRARVRTAAGEQWRVSRELYRRIAAEFSKAEIQLGVDPVTAVATIAE